MTKNNQHTQKLLSIVSKLRSKDGCPWDKKQTITSLTSCFKEELGEVLSAIEQQDYQNLCEELGDLLYLILITTEVCKEEGHFHFDSVVQGISEKLTRRHPHVFGKQPYKDEKQLADQWLQIKAEEKVNKSI